ncbi:hypothetical protein HY630_03395 [Candidatus Uhrbacteria bacterium]|nr:hypothetical protein [Candidatus Uhrbacteria bacterium]
MAGDLVKGSLPAVYYVGGDGKRYVFPNEKTYKTWYADFSLVKTMSDAEIAAMPIGGNVVYRGGARLVKIQTDPRVYVVEPSGKIRWVETESVASALYGAGWASRVDDVPDVFFVDYTPGASVADASRYPTGSLVKNSGDPDVYYIDGASKRWLANADAMSANRFRSEYVVETSQNLAVYTDGANVTGYEAALADTSQKGGVVVPTGGGLMISLSSDNPVGATVPQGASSVPVLALNFSASSSAVTVTSLVLKRFGVGNSTDFSNVYLYNADGSRMTDGRTVNSSTQDATFAGLSIAVPASGSTKVWVRADIGTSLTSGSTHGFQITAGASVGSNAASVTGSFPVSGNLFTVGAATAGTLTIDASGTIANPTLGQKEAEIARFTLATATEDASVKQVNFDLEGTINNPDLTNLSLWQGTTKLATVAAASSKGMINLVLNPAYALADGTTKTFSLKGDIGGEAGRTVGIRLEERGDISAIGGRYGFGMQIVNSGYNGGTGDGAAKGTCAATTDDCSFSTVQGSKLTFAFNGPSAGDISVNSQNQVFMKFSLTAQQFTTVKDLIVVVSCQVSGQSCDDDATDNGDLIRLATEANLKDIRVVKSDGSLVMGPLELSVTGSDASQSLTFTDDFTMNAGQTLDLMVTADVDNNATAAEAFRVAIDMSEVNSEDSNGDRIAAANIVPSADINGNNQTLRAATLTLSHTTPPSDGANNVTVRGTSNKDSVAYSFAASNSSDLTVSLISVTASVDGDSTTDVNDFVVGTETEADGGATVNSLDMISSASIYDGDTGTLIAGPESVTSATTGVITFRNFVWTIPKGQAKKLLVKGNIANYSVANEADAYALRIAAIGDVTVQDKDGNSASVSISANNGTATAPTVYVRVSNSGTIAASRDAGSPNADLVLAGATDVTMSKFRFDATDEGMLVKRITVSETNAFAQTGTGGDYDNNISSVKLSYQKQDGTTATQTGFLTAGQSIFNLPSGAEFYVPANKSRVLTVMMSLPTIDNRATTGEKPRLDLELDATNDDQVEIIGASSGVTLDDDNITGYTATVNGNANTGVTANPMVVRETKPTITLASGSPSGSGVPGLAEVFRFTVSAAAGEDVILKTLTFKLTSTDNNGDSGTAGIASEWNTCRTSATSGQLDATDFSLFDTADPSTPQEAGDSDWAILAATGAACGDNAATLGFVRLTFTAGSEEVVAAGTTKTYSLKVDTTGASAANDDSFRVDMVGEPIVALASFLSVSDLNENNLTQTDTTLTVTTSTGYTVGDLLCMDTADDGCASGDEIMLLTAIPSGTTLTVYRGDLGTVANATSANDAADDLDRMPSTLYWDDDGASGTINGISGYLVKNLDVTGGTIVY